MLNVSNNHPNAYKQISIRGWDLNLCYMCKEMGWYENIKDTASNWRKTRVLWKEISLEDIISYVLL